MSNNHFQVPYGYEPPVETRKGTIIAYDSFEEIRISELAALFRLAEERDFVRVVLYPIHEETGRRMGLAGLSPYHKRVKALEELAEVAEAQVPVTVDRWEGKRKKYTPVETALDFLAEKYRGPYFVWMTEEMAGKCAAYASFDEWIRKVRLLVAAPSGKRLPAKMEAYASRWEYVR